MNGVESIGNAGIVNRVPGVTSAEDKQPTSDQDGKRAGMEGAMKLSNDFLKEVMVEIGFIDIHAGCTERIKAFVSHTLNQEQPSEVSLDPVTAAEMAALAGGQILRDAHLAERVQAQIDPIRAAALLK